MDCLFANLGLMPITIARAAAIAAFEEAAKRADARKWSSDWEERIRAISTAAQLPGVPRTHIAFLGNALLAKAADIRADVFAVKSRANTPGAFSARSLATDVLVPNAGRFGVDLGRSGREPLNNQPYFRTDRVSAEMIVRGNAGQVVALLLKILKSLQAIATRDAALDAFAAFVAVRREYRPNYAALTSAVGLTTANLAAYASALLQDGAEGGRIAQALVAGILDACYGRDRVALDRVNDPDRHCPGDVGVGTVGDWERVFEVRDKLVSSSDVRVLVEKVREASVRSVGVIALATRQTVEDLKADDVAVFASSVGISLYVTNSVSDLIEAAAFWSPTPFDPQQAFEAVYSRLIQIEASEEAVAKWISLGQSV